jgi:hypothetical protein
MDSNPLPLPITRLDSTLDFLQEPLHSSNNLDARLLILLLALDTGWQVIEPICLNPGRREYLQQAEFLFLLKHSQHDCCRLLAVPAASKRVVRLVEDEGWLIIPCDSPDRFAAVCYA